MSFGILVVLLLPTFQNTIIDASGHQYRKIQDQSLRGYVEQML